MNIGDGMGAPTYLAIKKGSSEMLILFLFMKQDLSFDVKYAQNEQI